MAHHVIFKTLLAGVAATALAACTTTVETRQVKPSDPPTALVGMVYRLPATRLDLVATRTLVTCQEGANDTLATTFDVTIEATSATVAGDEFVVDPCSLSKAQKQSASSIERHPHGTIKAFNASATDKSPEIIAGAATAVFKVARLVGPSGAGKTTVLSLLGGIAVPQEGRVMHARIAISAAAVADRRLWRTANVGFVFQTCRLIDVLTVRQHMDLVARLRGDPRAAAGVAIASDLGLREKLDSRPGALSGGEKQRVALAQALAHRPAIVLADEPTAALDKRNAAAVAAALVDYSRQRAAIVVAVSHDETLFGAADDIVRLEKV